MPLRRVRPMRRALVGGAVATAAYQGGKRSARNQQQADDIADLQAQQAPPPAPMYAAPPPAPAPVAAPPPAPDRLDELKKLADLKEMGVLTDEEFAAEKARLLAG
jgi:Short C-terminal domain